MNSRERLLLAMDGSEPDRIPCALGFYHVDLESLVPEGLDGNYFLDVRFVRFPVSPEEEELRRLARPYDPDTRLGTPLQMATYLGFSIAGLSALAILVVIYLRAFTDAEPLEGQATTLIMVLFLGSVQLISLGIIGEYLGRIYNEVRGRPLYIVRNALGVERGPHAGTRMNSRAH